MPNILADRVLESSVSAGTGVFTLAGAVLGFRAFSAVCAVTDTMPYYIEAVDTQGRPTGEWEYGLGTYSAANQLTRTTVRGSSNAGLAVAFSAGTKLVGLGIAAPNSTATRLEWRNALGLTAIGNTLATAADAAAAFNAIKQPASDTATGAVELATVAEVQAGADTARAITPAGFAASSFGYAQAPAIVTRTNGVTYTNTTGKPITLIFYGVGGGSVGSLNININGGGATTFATVSPGTGYSASFPVPIGATYIVNEVNISSRTTVQLG